MAKKKSSRQGSKRNTLTAPAPDQQPQRPRSPNHPMIVPIVPPACPACGSCERENFHAVSSIECDGHKVTWRNTRCKACGQNYRTRTKTPLHSRKPES